jgi:hypothetical protein
MRRVGVLVGRRLVAAAPALLLVMVPLLPVPALTDVPAAASPQITGVRVAAATSSSFTITLNSLGRGWKYRLYASTTKADLYYANLPTAPHRSGPSSLPRVSLSHLSYTSSPYWYRLHAVNGSSHHTSAILSLGLRPAKPSSLRSTRLGQVLCRSAGAGWRAASRCSEQVTPTSPRASARMASAAAGTSSPLMA